jgi:hypothetical protein
MPKALIGTANCPFVYHEDVAIAYEAEFCKLDDKRCHHEDCEVLMAAQRKMKRKRLTDGEER